MTQISQLLELRSKIKERKPVFIRQDNPKRMKLNYKWRKPKGIHSKIRHHFKGRRKMPSPGYKSPAEVKGLHTTGLRIVRVFSAQDLNDIKKDEGIIIPKSIGTRKRLEILKKAKEMNIPVLNLKAEEAIKKIENFINSKKKKEASEAKGAKKGSKEAKPEQQKEMTTEQKKESEKKEKDKVLTKRT